MFVVVPDDLYDAIQAKLDDAFKDCPGATKDRDFLYHELLNYYNEHGIIPDFSLVKSENHPTRPSR